MNGCSMITSKLKKLSTMDSDQSFKSKQDHNNKWTSDHSNKWASDHSNKWASDHSNKWASKTWASYTGSHKIMQDHHRWRRTHMLSRKMQTCRTLSSKLNSNPNHLLEEQKLQLCNGTRDNLFTQRVNHLKGSRLRQIRNQHIPKSTCNQRPNKLSKCHLTFTHLENNKAQSHICQKYNRLTPLPFHHSNMQLTSRVPFNSIYLQALTFSSMSHSYSQHHKYSLRYIKPLSKLKRKPKTKNKNCRIWQRCFLMASNWSNRRWTLSKAD